MSELMSHDMVGREKRMKRRDILMNTTKLVLAAGGLALVSACAQQEEPMAPAPAPAEQPIYSKDGRVIGSRPMVGNWGNGDGVVNELDD